MAQPDGTASDGPVIGGSTHQSGLWIVTADDDDAARQLALKGSAACGRPVEVRAFQEERHAPATGYRP